MEKKRSIGINLIFNVIKSALTVLFPLITLPYISSVLTQDSIGEYGFSTSIINYYLLISALGIKTFAIKEAGKYKDDKNKFDEFASNMFSLNVFFTLVAYILLGLSFFVFAKFRLYGKAIAIASFTICFSTIGVEWIFNIVEDFAYITYRSVFVQIVSLIIMFAFVRDASDAYIYMAISVIANGGANIFNWFYARKYCHIRLRFSKEIFRDIVPIAIIFFNTLATIIYVNSDLTMLGWMAGPGETGAYTVATKIYNTFKAVLNGIVPVFFARLSLQYVGDRAEYERTFSYAADFIACITIPMAIGGLLYGKEVILMLSTKEYLSAVSGMNLLLISLFFASMGYLYSSGAVLLAGKEKHMLVATAIGAVANLCVNYALIPVYGNLGAAIGTLVTEVLVCSILVATACKYNKIPVRLTNMLKCVVATIPFLAVYKLYSYVYREGIYYYLIFVAFSAIIYYVVLLCLKHEVVLLATERVMKKIKRFN
ncbi:MAG: flippase [Butyrivibrio sp.]|nr:flippase [Butyrivibrio sp.]MBR1641474.1 flippase [Butyrivibrio sp.]